MEPDPVRSAHSAATPHALFPRAAWPRGPVFTNLRGHGGGYHPTALLRAQLCRSLAVQKAEAILFG